MVTVNQNSLILAHTEVHHQRHVHQQMSDDIRLGSKISEILAYHATTLPELFMKW